MTEEDEVLGLASGSDCDEDDAGSSSSIVDSDSWDEEDNSEESSPEDLDSYEKRFLSLVDYKIKSAEAFCDHKHYVLSFAPPLNLPCERLITPEVEKKPSIQDKEQQTTEPYRPLAVQELQLKSASPISLESVIDAAREEIIHLRTNREFFVAQRKEVSGRLKHTESEEDSRWLYECEEAIDAIDTIIDYKNETICGRENPPTNLFHDRVSPKNIDIHDRSESDLMMKRLKNLSPIEQQRLFSKFFNKVVELRHSSKQLEKNVDQLEVHLEEMSRRVLRYQKKMRQQDEAYNDRLKMFMENSKHHPQPGRYDEPYQSHHRSQRQEYESSSRHHRRGAGVYESVREHHHRDRHRTNINGPEIIRDHRKITIQMPPHQNQHH